MSAEETGRRVLAGLAKGRDIAIARQRSRGQQTRALVYDLAMADKRGPRGLAKRIALTLRLSERHVKRILDTLSSVSDSQWSNESEGEEKSFHHRRTS